MVYVNIDTDNSCTLLDPSDPPSLLILCISNALTSLGYQFSNIIVNTTNGTIGQTSLIEIYGTDLPSTSLSVFYEDYGNATISISCANGQPTNWVIDDQVTTTLNTVQDIRLSDNSIAVSGPWILGIGTGQADMESDIQNWLNLNGYNGVVSITNPSPLPRVKIEILNTTAPLNGSSVVGFTNPYWIEF